MWALGAKRELSLAELCQALSVEVGKDLMPSRSATDVTSAIASMRGLVCVDEDDATIRLVRHSFRHYLLNISRADELTELKCDATQVQIELAHWCMTFLNSNIFTSSVAKHACGEEAALVVSKLVGASKNALQTESKTALSVLRARKHIRKLSTRSQSPSDEATMHDIEQRLAERITRLAEATSKDQSRQTDYPFLDYARNFWYQHCSSLSPQTNDPVWILFQRLFRSRSSHYEQPWYKQGSALADVEVSALDCLDPATLQSIRWSYYHSHVPTLAAALEGRILTIIHQGHRDTGTLNYTELLKVLSSLLFAPFEQAAHAICFQLHNDLGINMDVSFLPTNKQNGTSWVEKLRLSYESRPQMLNKFYHYCRNVKLFLAIRYDLPEYMDADMDECKEKIWSEFLAFDRADNYLPLVIGVKAFCRPRSRDSPRARGKRPDIRKIIRREVGGETPDAQDVIQREHPQSRQSSVVDYVSRLVAPGGSSFLDLCVVFRSRSILEKMFNDSFVDYEAFTAIALLEGEFDLIEQYILDRPEGETSGLISQSSDRCALA